MIFLSTSSARRTTPCALAYRCPAAFLSTSSARRTTVAVILEGANQRISIHVLREEDDR